MQIRRRISLAALFTSLLLGAPTIAAHAASQDTDRFPLQVEIIYRHGHRHHHGYFTGEGNGNLIVANQINGMQFSFSCEYKFEDSEADEFYPARWKHEGSALDILLETSGGKAHTCRLNIALQNIVYRKVDGHRVSMSQQQYAALDAAKAERNQSLAPADLDPSHYPIHIALLNLAWKDVVSGLHTGSGQGNIVTANGLNAVDFSLHCPVVIQPTPQGRYLLGRWLTPGTRMQLLLRSVDVDGAPGATCDLTTAVEPDVYVITEGSIKAVSQEEYHAKYAPSGTPPAP